MLDETKSKTRLELLDEEWRNAVEDLVLCREEPNQTQATLSKLRELNAQILAIKKAELDEAQMTAELELARQKAEAEAAQKAAELELAQQKAKTEEIVRYQEQQLAEQKAKAEEAVRLQSQQLEEQKAKEAKKNNVAGWIIGGLTAATGAVGVWLGYRSWKGTMIAEATGNPPMSKSSSFVKGFYSMYRK